MELFSIRIQRTFQLVSTSAWIESVTILFKETQEGKDIGRYDSGTNFKEIRA